MAFGEVGYLLYRIVLTVFVIITLILVTAYLLGDDDDPTGGT